MNYFTEKPAGRNRIDLVQMGIVPHLEEAKFCIYEDVCPDNQKRLVADKIGNPNEDLTDQFEELCTVGSKYEKKCLLFSELEEKEFLDLSKFIGQNLEEGGEPGWLQ